MLLFNTSKNRKNSKTTNKREKEVKGKKAQKPV
jgi:hypothetical protein